MNINTPVKTIYGNHAEKFLPEWTALAQALREEFPEEIESILMPQEAPTDIPIVFVRMAGLVGVLSRIKTGLGYSFLSDYTATDEEIEPRFLLVLHLMNPATKARVRIKVRVSEGQAAPTLTGVWEGANWAEREIYDMFGIRFEGHPDLRRILMDMRWEGHPLRKDYPLRGYQVFLTPEPLDPELLK
jgi:NADH-quinone oxidoreductase subunit C